MGVYDPREILNIQDNATWTPLAADATIPDYVRQALANSGAAYQARVTPENLAAAKLGTWELNGQKNYGFETTDKGVRKVTTDDGQVVYVDDYTGNTVANPGARWGIPIPLASDVNAGALTNDLRGAFRGQGITDATDSGAGWTFDGDTARPTQSALDHAALVEKQRAAASKVSPLAYLGPLLIAGGGLALGPLGGAAMLGGLGAGATEAGALGAAGAGAIEGGVGLGGAIPAAEGLTLGAASASGVPGGGLALGAAAPAASVVPGGGLALGAATPAASGGITGALSSAYQAALGTVTGALESAGLSSATAASVAPIVTKGLIGSAVGAAGSGATGGNPLAGALTGAIGGGLIGGFGGAEGALAQALNIGGGAADALIGATVGGIGNYAQGRDPLTGALAGGALGYAGNALMGGDLAGAAAGAGISGAAEAAGAGAAGSGAGAIGGAAAGKGISGSALALGALAGGAALLGNQNKGSASSGSGSGTGSGNTPGPKDVAETLGPYFSKDLNMDVSGRTVTDPWFGAAPSYWQYGGPEKTYYANNSLKSFGFRDGGGVLSGETFPTDDGREFSTEYGDSHVRGPGTGTSDSIEALLSDGEYVLTFRDVNEIGGGDNEKGAEKLDRLRKTGALARMLANVE